MKKNTISEAMLASLDSTNCKDVELLNPSEADVKILEALCVNTHGFEPHEDSFDLVYWGRVGRGGRYWAVKVNQPNDKMPERLVEVKRRYWK